MITQLEEARSHSMNLVCIKNAVTKTISNLIDKYIALCKSLIGKLNKI